MSNLLAAVRNSAGALDVFGRALDVVQNNIGNASAPGYVKQSMSLVSMPFDAERGGGGGVMAGPVESSRDEYAECTVQQHASGLGQADIEAELLSAVEAAFPVGDSGGIANALNGLFKSFSGWSQAPNDSIAQSGVIESAQSLAQSFRDAVAQLQGASQAADTKLRDTVNQINDLTTQIRDLNVQRGQGSQQDPGLDARLHSALEQLSGLVGIKATFQEDSSVTVEMDGGVPLVVGDRQYDINLQSVRPAGAAYLDGPSDAAIIDSSGRDVTAQISTGELAGELHVRNEVIGGLLGDGSRQGDLNTLAEKLAGRINDLLAGGLTSAGIAPAQALFTYDPDNGTNVAATLAATAADALAAIDPGPPWVGNGIALKLAALGTPSVPEDTVDGTSGFVAYYAGLTTRVGRDLSAAKDNRSLETESLAQARNMRAQLSGVSLDQEAVTLMQYQRAYQAAARLITVLDSLTEATIGILQ